MWALGITVCVMLSGMLPFHIKEDSGGNTISEFLYSPEPWNGISTDGRWCIAYNWRPHIHVA
jgi:serine/threonine protein kinase